VSKYFETVAKNGFEKTWRVLPKKGVACLENNFLCNISKKEFLGLIGFF
jgi:hypothetical protein